MVDILGPDGAASGVTAADALDIILGSGDRDKKTRTPAELRAIIVAATDADMDSYEGCGNRAAGLVLEFMERHPESHDMPADSKREWPHNAKPTIKTMGIDDYMKQTEPDWYKEHENVWEALTGFLWGWAVNAARYCLALPPVINPAIMTINIGG